VKLMELLALLFVHPLPLPGWARLWMFLPLTLCVAVVYRATRAREPRELPRATLFTFVTIAAGMVLIALAAYFVHMAVIHWWS
jgi:hypothetical protein